MYLYQLIKKGEHTLRASVLWGRVVWVMGLHGGV